MRILVTGSAGQLGGVLVPRLRALGHAVTGVDVVHDEHTGLFLDVRDREAVRDVMARGFDAVVHAAGLHKPHLVEAEQAPSRRPVRRRPPADFVAVNVAGTQTLLEAAANAGVGRFVYTSTTSLMSDAALDRGDHGAAAWLDDAYGPLAPRDIYGVTKLAAEHLCRLAHLESGMAVVALRTSRFFRRDRLKRDDPRLAGLTQENIRANELLYRRVTEEDAAEAHVAALERAPAIGWGCYVVSAPTPFAPEDCAELRRDAPAVVARYFPDFPRLYAARGWRMVPEIRRVCVSRRAEAELGLRFRTDFGTVLGRMAEG